MASIGLAMAQGQKIAQDLALSQMNTMSGMARAAQEAETADQYFQPGAIESRKFMDSQQLEAVNNIKESMPLIKGMAVDPDTYAPILLEKTMPHPELPDAEWRVQKNVAGEYVAVLTPKDPAMSGNYKEIPMGTKTQMTGILSQNITATAMDQLKRIEAMKGAADASQIKLGEKLQEAIIKKRYDIDPTLTSKEKIAKYTADKGLAGTVYDADAGVLRAKIGKEGDLKQTLDVARAHLKNQGYILDERDNITGYDGKDLASMAPEERQAIYQRARAESDAVFSAARKNVSPGRDPAVIRDVGKAKGLPTKASPNSAPVSAKGGNGLPSQEAIEYAKARALARKAAAVTSAEEEAKREFYRTQAESAPGYRPKFY